MLTTWIYPPFWVFIAYTLRKDALGDLEHLKVAEDKVTEQVMLQCRDDVIRECETPRVPTHPLFGDFSPAFVDPFFNLVIESFLQVPPSLLQGHWVIISDHEPSLGDDRENEEEQPETMLRGNRLVSLATDEHEDKIGVIDGDESYKTADRHQNLPMESIAAVSRRRLTEVVAATPKHLQLQQRIPSCCLEQAFRAQRVSLPCANAINDMKKLQQLQLEKTIVFYRVQSSGLLNVLAIFAVASLSMICFALLQQRQDMAKAKLRLLLKQPRRLAQAMAQGKLSVAASWPGALALAAAYVFTVATIFITVPFWLAIGFALTTFPMFSLLVVPLLVSLGECTCCCCGATSPDAKAGLLTEDQACCSCCKGTGVCSIQCASCCGDGGCCGPDCCNGGGCCCSSSSGSGTKTKGNSSCCGCCCCCASRKQVNGQGDGCCCSCCSSKEPAKQDCTCCCCGATSPDAKAGLLTEDQACCSCCKGTGVCSIQCASCCGGGGCCCGPKPSNEEEALTIDDGVVHIQIV